MPFKATCPSRTFCIKSSIRCANWVKGAILSRIPEAPFTVCISRNNSLMMALSSGFASNASRPRAADSIKSRLSMMKFCIIGFISTPQASR
ncbi:Uncharacterised protein [Vibrio cholerae]|nr:hypothetical protein DN41_3352 [Vibrio cholerae]CSD02074.1 Uncharacterised protein [Vibrio cholerae]CSI05070.1 Uncharacterised protein [Vibrio cholerae]CSI55442.1 Uncharacterised protein [Vibrio cholerae]